MKKLFLAVFTSLLLAHDWQANAQTETESITFEETTLSNGILGNNLFSIELGTNFEIITQQNYSSLLNYNFSTSQGSDFYSALTLLAIYKNFEHQSVHQYRSKYREIENLSPALYQNPVEEEFLTQDGFKVLSIQYSWDAGGGVISEAFVFFIDATSENYPIGNDEWFSINLGFIYGF